MATKPTTKQTTSKATKKPATPAKTPRAAKEGGKAGRAPAKPKAATEAQRRTHAPKPDGKGRSPAKRMGVLEAAAQVLGKAGGDMNSREMIEAITKRGLWSSPAGKTPHATLYSAILREIGSKGRSSRFKKTTRGRFAAGGKAG